jgi:spore maturation protein CgeB
VILQGAKSRGQKIEFEIRYGFAQKLQEKSRTPYDLAAFMGDFIGIYNAETARKAELKKAFRKPVRDDELNQFYALIDKYPSKVVGALLASYGFALTKRDEENTDSQTIDNITEKQ